MAILGLTRQGDVFRFVLCEYVKGTLTAQKFGEVMVGSWDEAITTLAEQTGASELAVAIEPPDLSIQEVDVSNLLKPSEKRGAVRNKAIVAGFDDRDDIRVRVDEDENWYFAALRAGVKREIRRAAAKNKMRIVRIENAAYCWVRFLDGRFSALVDASTENRVAVLVVGNRRAELRVFDAARASLLDDIEKTFDNAVQHGFARAIQVAALIDPKKKLASSVIGRTALEPYVGTIPANNAGFVVPLGVVFAAAGGTSAANLLDIDFAEREQFNFNELIAPLASRLPQADLIALGVVVGLMVLLSLVQWIRGTQLSMHAASLQAEVVARQAHVDSIRAEATNVAAEAKRVADAGAARQSGGVAARRLAQWMRDLPGGVTLETVSYDAATGNVSVTGDAQRLASAETAFRVINQPASKFTQTGTTFTVERDSSASSAGAAVSGASTVSPPPATAQAAPSAPPVSSSGGVQ